MCVHERQYALIHDEHVINCKFSIITENGVEVYPELGCPKKRKEHGSCVNVYREYLQNRQRET